MTRKDILIALGVVDVPDAGLGLEAAGVVRRVGPQVKDLKVGNRVIVMGTGCFSTLINTTEKLCAKMPGDLSFEDGATMPCVYGTVIYSLMDIGRLSRGQVSYYYLILRQFGSEIDISFSPSSSTVRAVELALQLFKLRGCLMPRFTPLSATRRRCSI